MAPASAKRTEKNPNHPSQSPKGQCGFTAVAGSDGDGLQLSVLPAGLGTSRSKKIFNPGSVAATVGLLLHYEILQFPFEEEEEDDEFFGGLCGGLKDFERFRLLPLLPPPPPPVAALLVTE